MWFKYLPWRYLISNAARRHGFLDPINVFSKIQNFSQPCEVAAPNELLRSGALLHARGLINSYAIPHNLDWVWPYWVERQYNPESDSFIPRAFSLTQINLTHRNWTAVGIPGGNEFPIVDPRGLITPFYDGWSIDVWIIPDEGNPLIPSLMPYVSQKLGLEGNLCVITEYYIDQLTLTLKTEVIGSSKMQICRTQITGSALKNAQLIISLRPYNPEGVSFVNNITLLKDSPGWHVNWGDYIYFDKAPDRYAFSYYNQGDVFNNLDSQENKTEVACKVGMATAAAIYKLAPGAPLEVTVSIPLSKTKIEKGNFIEGACAKTAESLWEGSLQGACSLQIPDEHFQFLYEAAVRTMILHSPEEVYPGPCIYRRFWFRDAAFILYALLSAGLTRRVERSLDRFRSRQTISGYFLSQEGEWDSNGEALWITRMYCEMTGSKLPEEWKSSIEKAADWICKKRLPADLKFNHAGLLPAGFSAEHFGPNNYYYWDDFWGIAGLKAAALMCENTNKAKRFEKEADELLKYTNQSLENVSNQFKRLVMPAAPYRRLDSGAVGTLVASYPLHIYDPKDPRILDTAEYLIKNCLFNGGFFHDIAHSGINPYLTLDLAQVLLRAGDARYFNLMTVVAGLASPTGQWPEAIHPKTGGGCMGDGQHVWAAAEWVLMIRNCFVREESEELILCSGIPESWLAKKETMAFGPAPTRFGDIQISIKFQVENILIEWQGKWFAKEPPIYIQLPGFKRVRAAASTKSLLIENKP
ncbi:MAG: hypothetical protein A3J83_00310 [Elusimicrobia bacterium RIFOXYA2_FULL_40_6]|nr:MAG: hypothetical protein A3J83_00310 [Elusimicrobia bacterium RIFOXYA2_FULL_40_6]